MFLKKKKKGEQAFILIEFVTGFAELKENI